MTRTVKNNFKLGVFVTVGVVLFTFGVYVIGNQQHLFRPRYRLNTFVSNANGLRIGNNVRYAGIVVGSVEEMVFVNDSTLRLQMVLDAGVKQYIRKDAVASIGLDGLVGNVIVNIAPGNGHTMTAENGDTIASFSRLDPNAMLETLGSASDNVSGISQRLLEVSEDLHTGTGMAPRLINDSLLAEDFAHTLNNLRKVSENMLLLSENMRRSMDAVEQGKGTLGYLLHDQTLPRKMEDLADRLDSLLIVQTRPILEDLQQSGEDIAASSQALKSALSALDQGPGLANTLLKDSLATHDLRGILENLNEGTHRFNQNMEALKHNFLFRKYFKKLEKEKKRNAAKTEN